MTIIWTPIFFTLLIVVPSSSKHCLIVTVIQSFPQLVVGICQRWLFLVLKVESVVEPPKVLRLTAVAVEKHQRQLLWWDLMVSWARSKMIKLASIGKIIWEALNVFTVDSMELLEVTDSGDGSYTVVYLPTMDGCHLLMVKFTNHESFNRWVFLCVQAMLHFVGYTFIPGPMFFFYLSSISK